MSDANNHDLSIAIISMAGRFPGAADVEQLWRNLRDGVESIRFFEASELEGSIAGQPDPEEPGLVRAGGVLDDVEGFDAAAKAAIASARAGPPGSAAAICSLPDAAGRPGRQCRCRSRAAAPRTSPRRCSQRRSNGW